MTAALAAPALALEVPELDCVIEPHMVIDLSSRTDGIVDTIEVERGDAVEAGQVVVQLESDVERAAVEYARAAAQAGSDLLAGKVSAGFAERRRDRLESLYVEKVLSSDQMDEMETEAELSRIQLDQARERNRLAKLELRRAQEVLAQHTLHSPIDGVVVQRFLSPGESVEEKPILRLAKIDPLRVEVIVPVSYFGAIDIGQQAVVSPERPIRDSYTADVTVVDRVADAASGTFRVRLSLPNPDYSLPSGLNCMVRFLAKPVDAPLLAENAEPVVSEPVSADTQFVARAEPMSSAAPIDPAIAAALAYEPSSPPYIPHAGIVAASQATDAAPRPRPQALQKQVAPVAAANSTEDALRLTASAGASQLLTGCKTIGPVADSGRADELKTALRDFAGGVRVREEVTPISGEFVVTSADQGSLGEAKALAKRMREAGLGDMFVFGRGPYKGRVSLGLYRKEAWAEERVKEVQAAGFFAETVPRHGSVTRYWIDFVSRSPLPLEARDLLADEQVTSVECEATFASES
ncbi:MAG: efflux RND transporter periplasmic adaptor subunit [Gammaproteobacteria bacterium]|nr:efflux RND transporter periplasmic adaptor subunit [Gammaproteobacteria bacterium]MBT8443506.1 efflux RND transporter periplasmic adaptor subunit [Gammaproteobacteria bacterium]NND36065.1 efflux RND transporter periplasmic adaptor subunit [Gammaproteobacteria bacterium]